jgi:nucleoid DNA-binding protein
MATIKKIVKKHPVKSKKIVVKTTESAQSKLKAKPNNKVFKKAKWSVPETPYKKSEFLAVLAEHTDLARKDIAKVLEAIGHIASVHLVKNGPGVFIFPGFFKMTIKLKPATQEKPGINPFTGEAIKIKAKPASRTVRVRVLKKFKSTFE